MRVLLIFFTISFSFTVLAKDEVSLKNLMANYIEAFRNKDPKALKKISTPKFYKMINSNGVLEHAFKQKIDKSKKYVKGDFDLIYKRSSVKKDLFFVNIKNKNEKNYGEYWYYVQKLKNSYLVDDMRSLER